MKSLKRKIKRAAKKALTSFLLVSTVVWSIGAPLTMLFAPVAQAVSTTVVISEIQTNGGGSNAAYDEFIELYNKSASAVNLSTYSIQYRGGESTSFAKKNLSGSIPAYGFYLITNSSGYDEMVIGNDTYTSAVIDLSAVGGTVFLVSNQNILTDILVTAGTGIVDKTAWGAGTYLYPETAVMTAPAANGSIERKASATSTSATMTFGGGEDFLGNGYDADSNSGDFTSRSWSNAQKSTSPIENPNFGIMNVMPMNPQTVSVMFNKPIKVSTALPAVATLSTANTTDNTTITSVTVMNNSELQIYASGANINGSAGTDTITISNVLLDTGNNANTSTGAQTIQFYMPPEVTGVQYVDANNIKIFFSKAMEEVSAENYNAYGVYIDGVVVILNEATWSLNTGGDSKTLTITKTSAFNATGGNDYVIPVYDFSVSAKDSQGSGIQPTFGWQTQFTLDGTAPTVTGGMYDATAKTITLYFSEELLQALPSEGTLTPAYYTVSAGCGTPLVNFKQNLNGPPSYNTVVLACPSALVVPFTVTVASVTDKAGNVIVANGTTNVYTASATANNPIRIASVSGDPSLGSDNMMMDGCSNEYGTTGNYYKDASTKNNCDLNTTAYRDKLTVVFDGAINPVSINYDSTASKAYNIGSRLEVFQGNERTISGNTTLADCQSWETYMDVGSNEPNADSDKCVNKSMGNLGNSFGVLSNENKTLTVYLQGADVMLWPGMEVNPVGIMGMNGLTALQNVTADNNRFTMTFAEVEFVKATKAGASFAANDTVTLFFSGDMTRGDIPDFAAISGTTAKLKPVQHAPFWAEHNWGTGGAVAWGNHDGATCTAGGTGSDSVADCLKITLGASPTVANKDDIMTNSLKDANGMYLGWGGVIDTTVLAVSNYTWNSTFTELTLEFNKMLNDYNATGNPPTPNFSNNTIGFTDASAGGVTITEKTPVFDTTTGGMGGAMDMFKKIKLTFSGAAQVNDVIDFNPGSAIGDENGNVVPDISVKAVENLSAGEITLSVDSAGPILAQVITNDWNRDGLLNGGDEMIFIFDNVSPAAKPYISDVNYSTVSSNNLKADFIVKRGSAAAAGDGCPADGGVVSTVLNPFGEWINFWVDMWEEHAGELHLNLGPGSDVRAGDRICSSTSSNLKDFAGNSLAASKVLAVVKESRDAEISKIVYSDVDTSGTLTNGDTFAVNFSEAIDPYTLGSYTPGTNPPTTAVVSNVGWGLGVEFNWEAGYGSTYTAGAMKTWGNNSTGAWNSDYTKLTITLACTGACDATDGTEPVLADFDMVKPYSVKTVDGAWVNKPGFIDLVRPTLQKAVLMTDANTSGSADQVGDKIVLVFSEEMDQTTITSANVAANIVISGGKDLGATPTVNWVGPDVVEITIANLPTAAVTTAQTFNPANAVTDLAGMIDNTTVLPILQAVTTRPVSNVVLSDSDTTNGGIDGRDINVTWGAPSGADATYTYDIYVLPDFVPFNPDSNGTYVTGENTHFPVANVTNTVACTGASCSNTGLSTLMTDSRTAVNISTGALQSGAPFFPVNDWENYIAYVVAINGSGERSFPQRSSSPIHFTMEYGGGMDNQAPWVEYTTPFDGAIVPTNTTKFEVKFSEPMKRDSIETSGKIKLQTCSADCQTESNWSNVSNVYVSYNADYNRAEMSLSGSLTANAKYRIDIPSPGVQDMSGLVYTGRPVYFRASSESDTTPPKVMGNSFQFEGIGTLASGVITEIPRTEPMVGIAFDKNMDSSTFTTTSVTLTPSVPGSNLHYEPQMMGMGYFFGSPLAQNTTYTLTLSGVYIKDSSGNTLDGDASGTAAGTTSDNYTFTFKTKDLALDTTTKPVLKWINSDGHHIGLGFSADMKQSAVTDKANWALVGSGGAAVSIQGSNLDYDPFMKELHIGPIELTPGQNYTFTPKSSVLGTNGAIVDTVASVFSFTPQNMNATFSGGQFGADMYATGGIFGDGGIFGQTNMNTYNNMMTNVAPGGGGAYTGVFDPAMAGKMYTDNAYMDKDIKTFMPINVWPMNQIEGKITNYHIGFPTTKAVPHGGKIVLKFPNGFDVTNAAVAVDSFMTGNPLFFFNQDVNGPGGTKDEAGGSHPTGRVQISNVAINNMDKTITLTVAVEDATGCTLSNTGAFNANCTNTSVAGTNTTMPFDYFDFELSGIKNGSASEIDWRTDTGGYQITITTKDNNNTVLEGGTQNPIKSMKFPIKAAGAGSISGKVTAQDGVTAIPSAMVFIDSPMSGPIDTMTGADGTYSVSGLPVVSGSNTYEGWYHIRVESPKNNDNYFGGADFDVQLTQSSPTASGKSLRLSSANRTLTVKLTITSALDGKEVMVWTGGPVGHNEKKFIFDTTDDDGVTAGLQNHLDIKVADGDWDVGVNSFFAPAMFTQGPPPPPPFLAPAPKHITVSGDTNISLSLVSGIANFEITGIVKDDSTLKGLSNMHVRAFTTLGPGFSSDTDSRTDGSFTLKVPAGFYQIEVSKPGLPPIMGKTVEVKTASVSGVEILVHKPARTISGKVTDGTNPIPRAGVNAWDSAGRFVFQETDANGEFSLFVDSSSSWNVEVFAPGFGKLRPDTGVLTTNLNTTSADVTGINFNAAQSDIVTISGTVKDASGNAVEGVKVRANETNWDNGAEGTMTGVGISGNTDADGAYTLKVPASTAGTGADATRYKISAVDEDTGKLTPVSGVNASSNITSTGDSRLNLTMPTSRTITVDIQNAPDINLINPDNTTDFFNGKAFVSVFSDTSAKGNEKEVSDTDLSDTSDGTVKVPEGSGYRAELYIPGYGEFDATENGTSGFSVSGSNKTVHFDLSRGVGTTPTVTIGGEVTSTGGTALSNAYVSVINEATFETVGEMTDANGNYSLKVADKNPDGTDASYKVRVDKDNYTPPTTVETNIGANKADADFEMKANSAIITGTVYADAAKTIPVADAVVMAKEVGGEGFVKIETDSQGKFIQTSDNALEVAPDKTWNLVAKSVMGSQGQKVNISSGTDSVDIVLSNQIKTASEGRLVTTPKTESVTPSSGATIDYVDTLGMKLDIPEQALGTSTLSGGAHVTLKEIGSVPETTDFKPLGGIGKEITSTTEIQDGKMVDLEFVYEKDKLEAMTDTTATTNNLAQLSQVTNVYWNDAANNYVPLATTRTVETKAAATDEWTPTDWSGFITAVGVNKDVYNDYKITLKSETDHFTIFGLKVGSDSTPPAAPTGLAQTSGSGTSVVLDWNNNSESDLMEYEVYRSTSSGVTKINANQRNTSQVATSIFTDSTTAWTSYYYTVTASDNSWNESAVATEIRACSNSTVANGTVANTCVITCNTGYTLSGNSCVSAGGGAPSGGGGSSSAFTGSIVISNNVARTAARNITLQLSSSGATQMAISNSYDFAGTSWETYSTSKSWTLTEGDGVKNVYAKFKNSSGTISAISSDSITLGAAGEISTTPETPATSETATSQPDGTLIKYSDSPKVYVVKNGNQVWIQTLEEFNAAGYKWENVKVIAAAVKKEVGSVTLLRADGDNKVYVIHNNKKKHIPSAKAFNDAGYKWEDIKVITVAEIAGYSDETSYEDGTLIKSSDSPKVYVIKGGKRAWISSAETFNKSGYKWTNIVVVDASTVSGYEETSFENTVAVSGDVVITAKWLRIRSSGATTSKTLGFVKEGEKYSILEESGNWYKIKTSKGAVGWISGDYAKKR